MLYGQTHRAVVMERGLMTSGHAEGIVSNPAPRADSDLSALRRRVEFLERDNRLLSDAVKRLAERLDRIGMGEQAAVIGEFAWAE